MDETSYQVGIDNWWVWVFATPQVSFYVLEPSRGKQVLEQVLATAFTGTLVSDGWKAYRVPVAASFQRCWAHLFRYFEAAVPTDPKAPALLEHLRKIFHEVKTFLTTSPSRQERALQYQSTLKELEDLLKWFTHPQNSATLNKALEYLANGMPYWLTAVLITGVTLTNNRAEQDLRDVVVLRKIKECLRTPQGAKTLAVLLTLEQTARLHQVNFLAYVFQVLSATDQLPSLPFQ